jgi:uncharacterized protein
MLADIISSSPVDATQKSTPFTTFVVKVVSRCNLNCSYCYMYNLADKTYQNQPSTMSEKVTKAMTNKIALHSRQHEVHNVHIILHGGEPLLMGKQQLQLWTKIVRDGLKDYTNPFFSIQSNGVLIDDEWIDLLSDLRISVGISVDGPKDFHNLYRLDHSGRGSFEKVISGIRKLQTHPRGGEIFSSVMSVVNTDISPKALFDFWQFLDVSGFDISLPHANHLHPPRYGAIPYGEWMIEFFDLWFNQNRPDRHVRYFENILRVLFRYPFSTDNIGGKPVGVVVVETDGSIEPTDAFKCCEEGITKLGLNVLQNDFDDLYRYPMVNILQQGVSKLCGTCQICHLRDVCGGGYMPHRFSQENNFDNPSVYCSDLTKLIQHIRERVLTSLPLDIRHGIEVLSYGEYD